MATEEKSRDAFEPTKRYAAVGMQLGRVLVDDDFNEAERIRLEEERRVNLDVIGPVGSPDDGFLITPHALTDGRIDLTIGGGTLYLGGLRLWNPATATYAAQPDWLQQAVADRPTLSAGTKDLVYVEAWQQPVSAVEDGELYEVALGGPDTSTRLRTMWRVRIAPRLTVDDCPSAWTQVTTAWQTDGLGTIDATGERVTDAELTVSYLGGGAGDLCTPAITSGYLGAENQTIRVQLVDATHLTWGVDNGAPLYRAALDAGGLKLTLASEPRDQAHWPVAGQIIELLPWSAVLSNGEKLAEESGQLLSVTSYNPQTREVGFAGPAVPATFGGAWKQRPDKDALDDHVYYFVRVWDRGDDPGTVAAIAFVPGTPVTLGTTGLQVKLTGSARVAGAHWIIAARPKTPAQVVPWELESGRRAHGTRRWFAPLALIQWKNDGTFELLHDCRPHFLPLTRLRGCCTYTVGDEIHSFGRFKRIQDAVDALPAEGGKVCVLPGVYQETVLLIGRKHVTIEGCGRRSIVRPTKLPFGFFAIGGGDLTIRSLAIDAPAGFGVVVVDALKAGGGDPSIAATRFVGEDQEHVDGVVLEELAISVADYSAIALLGARNVIIRRCDIVAGPMSKPLAFDDRGRWPAILSFADRVLVEENRIAAPKESVQLDGAISAAGIPTYTRTALGGIQLGGGSEHVELRRNVITGGNGDGITLGSWAWVKVEERDAPWEKLVELWIWIGTFGALIVNDDGCVEQDPDPEPPDGDDGDYVPVSMGDLLDIRIIDNTIEAMGKSGIGVARFFDLAGDDEIIAVRELEVTGNRIRGCLQLAIPSLDKQPELREVTGFGAIALAEIADAVFRDNDLDGNGRSHVDPVCGLFALRSSGVRIERNRIIDNAPWVQTEQPVRPGWRGGVVLYRALPPTSVLDLGLKDPIVRQDGEPAVRITDNVIVVPNGRAILVLGVGQMTIHDNQLTVRGVGRADLAALFSGQFGTDVDGNATALGGWTLAELLDFLGGVAVLVVDLGFSNELFGLQLIALLAAKDVEVGGPGLDPLPPIAANGQISFNDNQVGVDLLGPPLNTVLSAVALIALDDVSVADNQIELDRAFDRVLATVIALGMSTRVAGNRIKEALLPGTSAAVASQLVGVSALTVGLLMNDTSHNQTTRCLTVAGMIKNDTPNQVMLSIFKPDICGDAKAAEAVATSALPTPVS